MEDAFTPGGAVNVDTDASGTDVEDNNPTTNRAEHHAKDEAPFLSMQLMMVCI